MVIESEEGLDFVPLPAKKWFDVLGIGKTVTQPEIIRHYARLKTGGYEEVEEAFRVLMDYYLNAGPDPVGTVKFRADTKESDRPPDRYFKILGVVPDDSMALVKASYAELAAAVEGCRGEGRLRDGLDRALKVISSYNRREEELESMERSAAREALREEIEAEADVEPVFAGPPAILRAYKRLGVVPGTYLDDISIHYMVLVKTDLEPGEFDEIHAAFSMLSRWWQKQIDEVEFVETKTEGESRRAAAKRLKVNPVIEKHLMTFGLKPGATLGDVNQGFEELQAEAENSDQDASHEGLREAAISMGVLAKFFAEQECKRVKVQGTRRFALVTVIGIVLLAIMGSLLYQTNYLFFRSAFVTFEPGDEVFLINNDSYFGQITEFDSGHQFRVGEPVPAYEIRLARSDRVVWLNKAYAAKTLYALPPSTDK